MKLFKWLNDLLFPPKCPFCRKLLKDGEHDLCDLCREDLIWIEPEEQNACGEEFELCVAPLWYRDTVRDSFHRYKFQGLSSYAKTYGKLMGQCIAENLAGRYDLLTWAPLSRQRKRKRGYDQAYLLAAEAGKFLEQPVTPTLRKVRNPKAQSSLQGAETRRDNVHDCYRVIDASLVKGKRVLIIDDIVTTGATLSECARTLKAAGAAEVICAAFARAGRENGNSDRNL